MKQVHHQNELNSIRTKNRSNFPIHSLDLLTRQHRPILKKKYQRENTREGLEDGGSNICDETTARKSLMNLKLKINFHS